ncbi:MAG: hypothetical protein H6R19_2689 [Proteobacteria bacterium]|nr:hypothetical protein [Pseudomonadota bacterium]
MDGPPLAGVQVCPPAPLRYSHFEKMQGYLKNEDAPVVGFSSGEGVKGRRGGWRGPQPKARTRATPAGEANP